MLYRAEETNLISGIKISREAPFTHLKFADDLLILSKAKERDIKHIQEILQRFSKWSGQKVNLSKSGLFFSSYMSAEKKGRLKRTLGMRKLDADAKYLGNPLFLNRRKKASFQYIIDKIKNRLAS